MTFPSQVISHCSHFYRYISSCTTLFPQVHCLVWCLISCSTGHLDLVCMEAMHVHSKSVLLVWLSKENCVLNMTDTTVLSFIIISGASWLTCPAHASVRQNWFSVSMRSLFLACESDHWGTHLKNGKKRKYSTESTPDSQMSTHLIFTQFLFQ